jgi:hypothetical protein
MTSWLCFANIATRWQECPFPSFAPGLSQFGDRMVQLPVDHRFIPQQFVELFLLRQEEMIRHGVHFWVARWGRFRRPKPGARSPLEVAGKKSGPGETRSGMSPRLERELQRELNQAWVVNGVGNVPEIRTGQSAVGRSELWVVEEVEELGTEFDVCAFRDVRLLENRKVEVLDALLSQRRVYAGLVAEAPVWWRNEATRVEPTVELGHRGSGDVLVAARDNIRPEISICNPQRGK